MPTPNPQAPSPESPDCIACPIKYVCGGECRLDSLERHGDIHKPDPVGCFFRRTIFEAALWVLCELGPEKLSTIIHLRRGYGGQVRNPRENRRRMQERKRPFSVPDA